MSESMPLGGRSRSQITALATAILGAVLFAFGLNVLITPLALYNGGFMGIAQLIRTFLIRIFHLSLGHTDITGIIYLFINIPLMFLAWSKMGRGFFFRSVVVILVQTLAQTLIPIPETPVIDDYLAACIIGGILAGGGSGLILRGSSSGGGQDILGMYMTQRFPGFSVGKVSLMINAVVYGICFFLFDVKIVVYCLIYGVVYSLACDRMHTQNINVSAMIFTKQPGIAEAIMKQTRRGVTKWEGAGAYTNEDSHILFSMISKYEMPQIRRIVQELDPQAFVIFTEGCTVSGNFEKRL